MKIYIIIAILLFILGCLNPLHFRPWPSFFSEFPIFISLIFLLISRNKYNIPNILLFSFFLLMLIVNFGQQYFTGNFFNSIYIISFYISMIYSYSFLTYNQNIKEEFFSIIAKVLLFISSVSALFALFQWLKIENHFALITPLQGVRPYANIAQPNNLSTFLCLGLISLFYFFEKQKIKTKVFISFFILLSIGIALTQSRTAWLIAIFVLFFIYINNSKLNLKVENINVVKFVSLFFLILWMFPIINDFGSNFFGTVPSKTMYERATSGHLRLDIWNQMVHAIYEKPWVGYGWNQTSSAQYAVIDRYHGVEWVSSAHNIILDILVWCGVPIGLIIILCTFIVYFKIIKSIKSTESFMCILMISAILIHAMLEFPLHYAFFLIPLGILIGFCLSEINLKGFQFKTKTIYLIGPAALILIFQVFKGYTSILDNMVAANAHEMNKDRTEIILPNNSIIFDKFIDRAKWISQYPYMKVDQSTLDLAERNLKNYLTSYDLHKYAVLLAHNGQQEKAERQLKILKIMYKKEYQYHDLFIQEKNLD